MAQAAEPGYGSAMSYLFDPVVPAVPVAGSSRSFPVRRIFCIGRNYAAHVREMGGDPAKGDPVVFMKPADSVVPGGGRLAYPPDTADLHHEVELVAAIGRPLHRANPADALDAVFGYAVGIDLTKRDRQGEAKSAGLPWERAKSFEQSAPISAIVPASGGVHPTRGRIALSVNGLIRQDADLSDMIWPTADIVARLSHIWSLQPGDLVFTGTPEGVGPLAFGDVVEARIESVGGLRIEISSGG